MSKRDSRTTPKDITTLKENEVYVYESNEGGIHDKGTALIAKRSFGAQDGKGWGPVGQSFALPTLSWEGRGKLPLIAIECYVGRFSEYAITNPNKTFYVQEISKLAGYTTEEIAPLFAGFDGISNVYLPKSYWDVIDKVYLEELVKTMMITNDGEKNELSNV